LALAAATPSLVRSEMSRRSKWAMAPKTWKTSSPAADEVSIFSSEREERDAALLQHGDGYKKLGERAARTQSPHHACRKHAA
jgi:hypothetical protein